MFEVLVFEEVSASTGNILTLHQRDVQSFAHPETPKTKRNQNVGPGGATEHIYIYDMWLNDWISLRQKKY